MFKRLSLFAIGLILLSSACTTTQVLKTISDLATAPLTKEEAGKGLKEALIQGITKGSNSASAEGGYFNNSIIRIPFPEDATNVAVRLREIGLGAEVDKFEKTLNRGAEEAAKEALPIFKTAITSLTFQDAFQILKGDKNAATEFLKRTTSDQLKSAFKPVMERNLNKVNATKYYSDLVDKYNKIPLVKKVNPELSDFATDKAIQGLFTLIEKEEKNIRENPVARTTDLLKKVFAQQ